MRILLVDDEPALRELLRVTFEGADVQVDEAASARSRPRPGSRSAARRDRARPAHARHERRRALRAAQGRRAHARRSRSSCSPAPTTRRRGARSAAAPRRSCASRSAHSICSRSSSGLRGRDAARRRRGRARVEHADEEVLLYARDLRHLLEIERGQRALLQELVPRDGDRARDRARVEGHAHARALAARRALRRRAARRDRRRSVCTTTAAIEYGFLLHDVGKIGIPDEILQKPGPLTPAERRRMQTHTLLGEQMLAGVAFLQGEGLDDRALASRALGRQGLSGRARRRRDAARRARLRRRGRARRDDERPAVPARARAGTRRARRSSPQSGKQFDPDVVDAFRELRGAAARGLPRDRRGLGGRAAGVRSAPATCSQSMIFPLRTTKTAAAFSPRDALHVCFGRWPRTNVAVARSPLDRDARRCGPRTAATR